MNRCGEEMKTSAQIIGLPIISIADGGQIGTVKLLIINPEKGSVDFLTIEQEDVAFGLKAIPFKKNRRHRRICGNSRG